MSATTLADQIAEVVAAVDFGSASARKGGRNPLWPHLPVIVHTDDSGVALGAARQETLVKRAFATREEAVDYAARVIDMRRANLAERLAEPRMRALRRQHRLPEEIDQ